MLTLESTSEIRHDDSGATVSAPANRSGSVVIGTWCLALTLALLAVSMQWLRGDARFRAAISLSTAAKLILSESAVAAEPEAIFNGAAQGMISVLDPYSSYLSPQDLGLFKEEAEGEYVGIGIEVRVAGGTVTISEVYPQSPAADALLRPGDRITAIDSASTHTMTFAGVVEYLRGEVGSPVLVEVERAGVPRREVRLVRRDVSIEAFPVAGISRSGVGYIRWVHFSIGSADRLAALVEELAIEEPIGLILDLRGNPGGVLDEAITAAGLFLPGNSDVCTLIDSQGKRIPYRTTSHLSPDFHGPLVIVQDETSASSAEVLIAALHDGGRAVTVGRRSFGKGWVQGVFPLDTLGAIRLSVAHYETPAGIRLGDPVRAREQYDSILAGRPWTGAGLEPDVSVAVSSDNAWDHVVSDAAVLSEFVAASADDWPAVDADDSGALLDALNEWLEGKGLGTPPRLGDSLLAALKQKSSQSSQPNQWTQCAGLLEMALEAETDLLLEREEPYLLRYLWEKRLQSVDWPDPGEMEALLDLDPDLSAARDLLEQPERFQILLDRASAAKDHASSEP